MRIVLIFYHNYAGTYVLTLHLNYVGNTTLIMYTFDVTKTDRVKEAGKMQGDNVDEKLHFTMRSRNGQPRC